MTIDLEYDEVVMYDNDELAKKWFFDDVLADPYLTLRSDSIADEVGKVRVIEIEQPKSVSNCADENKKLRAFAREVMAAWPEGGIEGDDLQEIAHRHGMLAPEIRHEPCGEWCQCNSMNCLDSDDWKGGVECYRRTALLTGAEE